MGRFLVVDLGSPHQGSPQRVAVIASVRDQAVRVLAGPPELLCPASWAGDAQPRYAPSGKPSTSCPRPACLQADLGPPFPSAKHSSRAQFLLVEARQSSRKTPLSSHALSRRQHVLGLPYRPGSSLQGENPFKTLPVLHRGTSSLGPRLRRR